MAKIVIVGGTWDQEEGKPSKVVNSLVQGIREANAFEEIDVFNGGEYKCLQALYTLANTYPGVMVWMPNVENAEKKVRDIKERMPHVILVSSKRNIAALRENDEWVSKYSFSEVVAHGLSLKAQLVLEIGNIGKKFWVRLTDTLGNIWCEPTYDWRKAGMSLAKRAAELLNVTRQGTILSPEDPDILPMQPEIVDFMKTVVHGAEIFHKLIDPPKEVTRFLGNASFRCMRGFPSLKVGDRIYVSKRNVEKRAITPEDFVQVGINKDSAVWYRGHHKPSVDTVIQVRLYSLMPDVNFMLHSHVYVDGAPTTGAMIPCGGLQEVKEIMKVVGEANPMHDEHFAVNLKGHGSILFMRRPEHYYEYCDRFVKRPWPEIM